MLTFGTLNHTLDVELRGDRRVTLRWLQSDGGCDVLHDALMAMLGQRLTVN
jgi:hypothetical protein